MPLVLLAALGGLAIGGALGLLGGGGTMLALPLLLALGVEPASAIPGSLLVVCATAALAGLAQLRAHNVDLRAVGLFAPFSVAGAYVGGRAAAFFPPEALVLLFAGLMVVTGIRMLRARPVAQAEHAEIGAVRVVAIAAAGLGVGAVTGLVGAGGGFLFVPAFSLLVGLPLRRAVGSSVIVIAASSAAALAGHLGHSAIPWRLGTPMAAFAGVGAWLGQYASRQVPEHALRRGFAGLVLLTAAWLVLGREPFSFLRRLAG